jgi:hypothetical protein
LAVLATISLGSCSSDADGEPVVSSEPVAGQPAPTNDVGFVADIRSAIEAVETELGGPQRYFEITANPQLTNIFVAIDNGTSVVPYLFVDGELQPPAPTQTGADGLTFSGNDVDFDENRVLARVRDELPSTSIEALSVYGDGIGATYVIAGRSEVGGLLDIVVTADGTIVSVDPN